MAEPSIRSRSDAGLMAREGALRRLSRSTTASISGPEAAGISGREAAVPLTASRSTGPLRSGASGFTRRHRPEGQLQLDLLPLGHHESSRPASPSNVRAFGLLGPTYHALC